MKKLILLLAIALSLPSSAMAMMDYTELRGLWEVKGTVYSLGPNDGSYVEPIKDNLIEIGEIPPFMLEIGDRDFTSFYADWTSEEQNKGLAALEAFFSAGTTNNLNEAIAQLPKIPYLYLPTMEKFDIAGYLYHWYGSYHALFDTNYLVEGNLQTSFSWFICDNFSQGGNDSYANRLNEDILEKAFAMFSALALIDPTQFLENNLVFDTKGYFSGEDRNRLEARFLSWYFPKDTNEMFTFYYKLTMERR